MKNDIGLNQDFAVGDRKFHLQTSNLVDDGLIRTEVFEKGRLLFVENFLYERRRDHIQNGPESRLRHLVDDFHQTVIEEIDCLFEMSERIFEEDSPSAHQKIGQVFLSMHIFDRAEKHFLRTMELAEERHSSYIYLGRCYYLQKRYHQAVDILTEVIDRGVSYPDMYNLMGLIMMAQKRFRQALHYFKEALRHNPGYIEAYFNLCEAILNRIHLIKRENKEQDVQKSIHFLNIILKKIDTYGNPEDRKHGKMIGKAISKMSIYKALTLMNEYRETHFTRHVSPEIIGYKFYLRLLYSEEEMSTELLNSFEQKLTAALQEKPSYPDLWHYLALIHLMQCRHFFLTGLDNFRDATRINPHYEKAVKNLRLVENDGREFLSLIKTIV